MRLPYSKRDSSSIEKGYAGIYTDSSLISMYPNRRVMDWMYRSGDAFLPPEIVRKLDIQIIGTKESLYYVNYWHFVHMFTGVVFSYFFMGYGLLDIVIRYAVFHTIWEIWQLYIGMTRLNMRGGIDILNDTFFGLLGVLAIYYSRKN